MTITNTIQSLEAKLARALKAKRRRKRRSEVYRDGLLCVEALTGASSAVLVRAARNSIREGDRTK